MRSSIFLGILLVTGATTGCVVRARGGAYTETERREVHVVHHDEPARTREVHVVHHEGGGGGNCPPGHRWSDGKCHSTGKGHDPHH